MMVARASEKTERSHEVEEQEDPPRPARRCLWHTFGGENSALHGEEEPAIMRTENAVAWVEGQEAEWP